MRRNSEMKAQAEELIRQIESYRSECASIGRALPRYVPVWIERCAVDLWAASAMLIFLLSGAMVIFTGSSALTDTYNKITRLFFAAIAAGAGVVLVTCVFYRIVALRRLKDSDDDISWKNVSYLQDRLDEVKDDLARYAEQLTEAKPWIEKIEWLRPVVVDELGCGLEFVKLLDEFKVKIIISEGCEYKYDLTESGYESLVCWITEEQEERSKVKQIVQDFESSLFAGGGKG